MFFVEFLQKAHAVDGTRAVREQRFIVRSGLVALVLFKAVLRILLRELPHQPVTGDLRDDGRRRDGRDLRVTRHHALVRKVEPLRAVAVHIDEIRRSSQTDYRLPHRTEGRL